MPVSRRNLLYGIATGIISGSALPVFSSSPYLDKQQTAGKKEPGRPIRLDRNENPYGPPEGALAVLRENLGHVNRYPDSARPLAEKLAHLHNVKPEQIVLGCGSSEVLRLAVDALLSPGKKLIIASPSYPLAAFYAPMKGAEVVNVPLARDRSHDLNAMLAQCGPSTGMVCICNPNNPTGTLTTRHDLEEFLRRLPPSIPVVIDEAYHHYVVNTPSYVSFIDSPINDNRIITTRTFSKIYALAGLRIGYAVASPEMAARLSPLRIQFGESSLAIPAAMAALDDAEHVRLCAQSNSDAQQNFYNQCKLRRLAVSDSHTNFSLIQLDQTVDDVIHHFRKNNIFVSPPFPGTQNALRVSMGLPDEMKEFWRVWDMLPAKS